LRTTQATNKVFVAITDGAWSEGHWQTPDTDTLPNNQIVKMMRKSGVHTMLFGIGMDWHHADTHDFELAVSVNKPQEVVPTIDKLVLRIMQKARARR
jgi:hypothetical protein